VDTLTPEQREDLIFNVLYENPSGIGFNKLQKKTDFPRKTLAKYLKDMKSEDKIFIKKTKKNNELRITAAFSEKSKKVIQNNQDVTLRHHWTKYKTRVQKSNVFPHFLQALAAEYYDYLVIHLFDNPALYKFALNRLEENLIEERKKLEKEFAGKDYQRVVEACEQLGMELWTNALSSMWEAGPRKLHRTGDEISMDMIHTPEIVPLEFSVIDKENEYREALQGMRADFIKDKKTKEKILKLEKEYNKLARKMQDVKTQLISTSGRYPFKDAFMII